MRVSSTALQKSIGGGGELNGPRLVLEWDGFVRTAQTQEQLFGVLKLLEQPVAKSVGSATTVPSLNREQHPNNILSKDRGATSIYHSSLLHDL